ncbi:hypothetical protein PRJ39_04570 [Lysobacter enzymogenes]|uniref:hypothetical protein n=1 Tax=Lysobacter enzymogenes TaxID=69 RepID=UPI003749024D
MSTPLKRPYRRRNVAKLLARLHPKGITEPFAGGRSTAPERETALDIAGALGAAGQAGPAQRLAIHVLCLRWWPGLFEGPSRVVGYRSVAPTAPPPSMSRSMRCVAPCTPKPALARVPVERPAETAAFRALADLIGSRLAIRIERDRAAQDADLIRHLAAWVHGDARPNTSAAKGVADECLHDDLAARVLAPTFLASWARAVIAEYRNPNHCPSCHGYGERLQLTAVAGSRARVDVASCDHCIGQGVMPWSKKRRAQQLVIGEHPFRQYLNAYHEGALALLRELEHRGAILLLRHLGSDLAMDTE